MFSARFVERDAQLRNYFLFSFSINLHLNFFTAAERSLHIDAWQPFGLESNKFIFRVFLQRLSLVLITEHIHVEQMHSTLIGIGVSECGREGR